MTNVIKELFDEQLRHFRDSFVVASRAVHTADPGNLRHPAEFGRLREKLCADLLLRFLPSGLAVGDGFLVTPRDDVSTQLDLVIYSEAYGPSLRGNRNASFFPVESVVGIGEVKSRLTKQQLVDALIKLSAAKALRERGCTSSAKRFPEPFNSRKPDWHLNPYDQLFCFLICEKFDFNAESLISSGNARTDLFGTEVAARHRINLILSLEDGLIAWWDPRVQKSFGYPTFSHRLADSSVVTDELHLALFRPHTNTMVHFYNFFSYALAGLSSATIFHPDLGVYLKPYWRGGLKMIEPSGHIRPPGDLMDGDIFHREF